MNIRSKLGAACAAFALSSSAALAIDVLHIANADSLTYRAIIEGRPENTDADLENDFTFTHVGNGGGAGVVGGLLSRSTTFAGLHGGDKTVKQYLESFDLIIIGNGINSANFTDTNGWSALAKPLLVHSALVARASSNGVTTDRLGLFTGGQNTFTYGNPADTLPVSPSSTLGTAIFEGVADSTNLYLSDLFTSAESNLSATTFGGGELISSLVTTAAPATPGAHGVVFWQAGSNNGAGLLQAAKRGYMVMRNGNDSSSTLTDDGKLVLSNLIDELLVESEVIFLPPTNLVAKSAADLKINLTWTASDGAVSYKIKRSETPGGPYTELVTDPATVTTTSYQDSGLTEGTTYYYVVSAVNASATESANSTQASASAVTTVLPGINILYVATNNNADYQNLLTNGQFADNTWTHKAPGVAGNNLVGGNLNRTAEFSGVNGTLPGVPVPVSDYLNSFNLVIIGVPTGSLNFIDEANGELWAGLTVPVMVHSPFAARAFGGRLGLFSGDNTVNPAAFVSATESVRTSVSPLSDAILAGVTDVTNLYASAQIDTINTAVRSPNGAGQGEEITRVTATIGVNPAPVECRGVVFWATGATLPVVPPLGLQVASNRAFLPLSGGPADLNADGRTVLVNLVKELQVDQNVVFPPLLTYPNGVAAQETLGDVYVSWEEAINAVSYQVKRATTAGGPYTQIATGVTDLYYTDTTDITPGATYYYVVSAVSSTPSESPDSDEANVTLPGEDNYEAWINTFLVQLPNAADRLPGADPDNDGSTNLVEFALNGNPANASDNGAIASLIQDSSLKLIVAVRDGALFTGGPTATVSGITYTVEGSLGLSFPDSAVSSTGPTDTAPVAAALPDLTGTDWEYHTFTLNASAGLTGKGFLRLKVTQP